MKNDFIYVLALALIITAYIVSFQSRWDYGVKSFTVWVVSFTVLVLLITMKVSFCNPMLTFLGSHVFSIYILQRIPMRIFQYFGWTNSHKYACLVITLILTILMAMAVDYLTGTLSKKLMPNKLIKVRSRVTEEP